MGELLEQDRRQRPKGPNVSTLLRLLCYLVKRKDDDGVDLLYFHDPELGLKKCKTSTEIYDSIRARTFSGTTTPTKRVNEVLNAYRTKLKTYHSQRLKYEQGSGRHHLFRGPPKLPKKLSVYVLTDAIWEDAQQFGGLYLADTIKSLVAELEASECEPSHVGVQFISFGQHEHGLRRLDELDRLAGSLRLAR